MIDGLDVLVKLRNDYKLRENPYIFGLLYSRNADEPTYIRCTDVLRRFSEECGASQPKTLRSTKLRKQIATQCQILNLKENELDVFASLMGHSKEEHESFYRLPTDVLQVAKVTKLKLAMDQGIMKSLEGRSLGDINGIPLGSSNGCL